MPEIRPAVLVTGGAARIGRAIALEFAAHGWDVGVHHSTSADAAERTAADVRALGGRSETYRADFDDLGVLDGLVDAFVDDFPGASALVNSASAFEHDRLADVDPQRWNRHLQVNALVPALLARRFATAAVRSGVAVVNVIDRKVTDPTPDFFSYTVSKVALAGITTMLARELAPRVRVNGVGPGLVLRSGDQTDAEFGELFARTPLGTGPSVEDVAAAVFALATNPAVTGQILLVDSGRHLAGWRPPGA